METVIQVLEKMGRATYREVAARLDIDPVDALTMLREQRDQGLCDFGDGGWFLGTVKGQSQQSTPKAPVNPFPRLKGEEPEPVDPDVVRQQLREQGAMTTVSLAAAVNRNARGMVSVLRALERQGVVVKNGKGKGVTWSLAVVTEPVKQEPVPEAPAAPEEAKPVEQIVSEIPSFTEGCAAVEAVPAVRDISREIRRTRNKLEQLTKLREAVRVIGRHRNLVQQLTGRE
ncbi:DUF1627 domain-containing protein [Enterobacter hormaechei]|uniref:DUF1627 domain-containing protein n=1 Tax=Enterobacter cloacae complex TaxID=354276 RepID=UPI0015E534C9|nr:DUF1627 domain-containing protein [Enterobacter hormaechei]DAG79466.1 MAG TPA: Protein of unknown function (DUF1627) [Caudoviricetes sp.]HCM9116056.1 hypothetical protein [Enterobacter hormaechei subsp. steigerwaltii]EHN8876413.1 hypothetical protein [Enterobacter hormaechei]ELC6364667.1 hypothetical protein [Enterobacter hormaechei]MCW4973796.1 DUF1627 domain-containing protein [Enterobacter hormaechei subsp. xiangfangensis]